jgi:glycosyltransferase involved in cell wall biosynthesis
VQVLVKEARAEQVPPGVTLHVSPRLMDRSASVTERLGAGLQPGLDAVHLHQLEDPDLVTALRGQAPVLVSAHGYPACTSQVYYFGPGEECTRAHGPACVPNLVLRGCAHMRDPRYLPSTYRQATRAVQALRECDLAVSYSSAVDRHMANNGIEPRRIVPLLATVEPARAGGHEQRRRVVFAGRLVAPKGVDRLIRAAQELPGTEFSICGDGWDLKRLRRLAERLGVDDRVMFRGWLAPVELARELAEASVVAIPSLWPEPFGLVGIEAFAAGRPVVASDTGGVRDWLQDGVSGLLVKPGDAHELAARLDELLGDPARQAEMGEAGRQSVAARFSPQHHLQGLLGAYETARGSWRAARQLHS